MKSKIVLFLVIGIILYNPLNVSAVNYCTNDTVNSFKSLTNNINVDYNYTMVDGLPSFTIRFTNVDSKFEIYDPVSNKTYKATNNEVVISGFNSNKVYEFEVYSIEAFTKYKMATVAGINGPEQIEVLVESNDLDCTNRYLGEITVNLPKFNTYSTIEECNGKESYELCDIWYEHDYSKEEFIEKVNEYTKENDNYEEEEIDSSIISRFNSVLIEYWYVFIALIVIITYVIIRYYRKKSKDGFVGW